MFCAVSSARNSFTTFITLIHGLFTGPRSRRGGGDADASSTAEPRHVTNDEPTTVISYWAGARRRSSDTGQSAVASGASTSTPTPPRDAPGTPGGAGRGGGASPLVAAALFPRQSARHQSGTSDTTCRVSSQTLQALSEPPECQTRKKKTHAAMGKNGATMAFVVRHGVEPAGENGKAQHGLHPQPRPADSGNEVTSSRGSRCS